MKNATTLLGMTKLADENRSCDKHGPYLATHWENKFGQFWTICPQCMREQQEQETRDALAQMEQERQQRKLQSIFDRAAIPPRYKDRTFDTYNVSNDGQATALRLCREYALGFDEAFAAGRCLVLSGTPGTGKTHLGIAIAQHIMQSGKTALYANVYDVVKRIRATWRKDGDSELEVIDTFCSVDLLVLDEIGTQFGTQAEQNQVFEVINARYMAMKPTIVISNLNPSDLKIALGERTLDRLRENDGFRIAFDWESQRSKL